MTDLTITLECNNNCDFCPRNELSTIACNSNKEIYENIEKISKTNDSIVLSGGEITIKENFIQIMKFCKKKGIKKIGMVTNGRMFYYDNFTRDVLRICPSNIIISIYSTNKRIHEEMTNVEGSFEQTIKGIENILLLSNNPNILGINILVSRKNMKQTINTMKELRKMGIKRFTLIDILTEDPNQLYNYEEFSRKINSLINDVDLSDSQIILHGFPYCIFNKNITKENDKGNKGIFIEPHDPDTLFHLNDMVGDYISNFNLKFSKDLEKCNNCKFKNKCTGIQKSRLSERSGK